MALSAYFIARRAGLFLAVTIKRFLLNFFESSQFRYVLESLIVILALAVYLWGPFPFTDFDMSVTALFSREFESERPCVPEKFHNSFIHVQITGQTYLIATLMTIYLPAVILLFYTMRSLAKISKILRRIWNCGTLLNQDSDDAKLLREKMTMDVVGQYRQRLRGSTCDSTVDREFTSLQKMEIVTND